jgi:hypothetical protein
MSQRWSRSSSWLYLKAGYGAIWETIRSSTVIIPRTAVDSYLDLRFTDHATEKLRVLRAHGVKITRKVVEEAVLEPERIVTGLGGRQVPERSLDGTHVLRVVFINEGSQITVITLYPARKGRY